MKKTGLILMLIFIAVSIANAQRIRLIPKDKRIREHQEQLVKYLIEQKQLDNHSPGLNIKDYKNKFYVAKCLELYQGNSNDLILVKFGNLDDHGRDCWGLLGVKQINLFSNTKGDEFNKLTEENRAVISSTVKVYVDMMKQ